MSLFYLLAVIALWVWLTRLFWRFWRNAWKKSGTKWRCIITPVCALIAIVWLSASFWYGGGQKLYWDARVRKLCAIDGGVKVYETVTLPADRFDSHGNINAPTNRSAKPTDEYYYEKENESLKTDNPSVSRMTTRLIRRSDGKTLGESVRYSRGGGDFPGPWHSSSFNCPSIMELNLETSIFRKEKVK